MQHGLFLNPGTSAIKLYSGSIFAPENSSQAEIFAAVAAALQELRVKPSGGKPLLGPRRHPIATVLAAEGYLRTTYTDTVIRASFLRGASWEELVYTNRKREENRSEMIGDIISREEADESNLSLEVVLADALGKVHIDDKVIDSITSQTASDLLALVRSPDRKS